MLERIESQAERLGVATGILTARALLVDNGSDRQRAVAAAEGLQQLVRWLCRETASSSGDFLARRS